MIIYDDGVIVLEELDGLLYMAELGRERKLVCKALFGSCISLDIEPFRSAWIRDLSRYFGDKTVVDRYYYAATDKDK